MNRVLSDGTRRNYRIAVAQFEEFCDRASVVPLPADEAAVASFLQSRIDAGDSFSTINVKRSAIATHHRDANVDDPTTSNRVRRLLREARSQSKDNGQKIAAPITRDVLMRMVENCEHDTIPGIRDRAVLLLGFACALRRSELVALDVADLQLTAAELRVRIRKSKTDQAGAGAEIVVPAIGGDICPVAAVHAWLDVAAINSGPIFRRLTRYGLATSARLTPQAVALIVKRRSSGIGLDEVSFSGHSLRAGFCTQAVLSNVPDELAMAVTRHKHRGSYLEYTRHRCHLQAASVSAVLGVD